MLVCEHFFTCLGIEFNENSLYELRFPGSDTLINANYINKTYTIETQSNLSYHNYPRNKYSVSHAYYALKYVFLYVVP